MTGVLSLHSFGDPCRIESGVILLKLTMRIRIHLTMIEC